MNIKYMEVVTPEEINKTLDLCEKVFGGEERKMFEDLFFKSLNKENNIILAAKDGEDIISTITLIDFPINYFGIDIKAAELGIVATDEKYRGKGINNKVTELYHKKLEEGNYLISVIEGIPYFYRKYGYNYSVKMGGELLNLNEVETVDNENIKIVLAEKNDLAFIFDCFKRDCKGVCSHKKKEIFETQSFVYNNNDLRRIPYIVYENDEKTGYFLVSTNGDIQDISNMSFNVYEKILHFIKTEYKKEKFHADIPYSNKFICFLKSKNSKNVQGYGWQIRILDDYNFLKSIKPVLEKRIAESVYKNEVFDFYYNNFKYLIKVKIENSKIDFVKEKFSPTWDFNLTPQGAVKLFFGTHNMTEINSFLPDCMADKKISGLIDVLFPKIDSFFYQNY
jgi:predicted acetyltransferase